MTAIAKRKPQAATIRIKAKKNLYDWADDLFYQNYIGGNMLHTLKAIIACQKLDRPTLEQINAARTKSVMRFCHTNAVTTRTLRNHIKKLEELGYIKVDREIECWYSRNSYTVMAPADKMIVAPQEETSPSICSMFLSEHRKGQSSKLSNPVVAQRIVHLHRGTKAHKEAIELLKQDGVIEPIYQQGTDESEHFTKVNLFDISLALKIGELINQNVNL